MSRRSVFVLVGQRFSRLVVAELLSGVGHVVRCVCDCRKQITVPAHRLTSRNTKSCGCLRVDKAKTGDSRRSHGHAAKNDASPEYTTWSTMRARCNNIDSTAFSRYGGRGIRVCERWFNSFENFLADMGLRPQGHEIDRINNDGPYSPENCRWATRTQQVRNRSNTVRLTVGNVDLTLAEWAETTGIDRHTLAARIGYGWTPERVVSAPLRTHKQYKNRSM